MITKQKTNMQRNTNVAYRSKIYENYIINEAISFKTTLMHHSDLSKLLALIFTNTNV